jgi:hypothetical protein
MAVICVHLISFDPEDLECRANFDACFRSEERVDPVSDERKVGS